MFILINIIVAVIIAAITFFKWRYQFWKNHNLKYVEPSIPFGNFGNPLKRTQSFQSTLKDIYDEFKHIGVKHGGGYATSEPVYIPVSPDYVKNILTKDFNHFTDRGIYYNEKDDPLSAHLFAIGGTKWRNLRVKLTPTFTSGKMKMMFGTLIECGDLFKVGMEKLIDSNEPIDIKEALGCFTTDVIGSCAFGLECHSIEDKDSPFRQHGRAHFERSKLRNFIRSIVIRFPSISRALHIRTIPLDTTEFFLDVVRKTVEYREKNNVIRNDFMQLLIDLKNNKLEGENGGEHDGKKLTLEEMTAQCFVFFLAGFETSSTVMTFALLELSMNQELQEKVRKEVVEVMGRHNNELTYEGIMEMKYMQQVIDESMRMYPPVPVLMRKCVKEYKVPDSDVTIPEGMGVLISTLGLHYDEDYFENPNKFDPDRFSDEKRKQRHPYTFLPFGEGPRNCIGSRFGYMQTKVGLATLLKNFKFTLDEKTEIPIKFAPDAFVTTVEGGVWLRAERL